MVMVMHRPFIYDRFVRSGKFEHSYANRPICMFSYVGRHSIHAGIVQNEVSTNGNQYSINTHVI